MYLDQSRDDLALQYATATISTVRDALAVLAQIGLPEATERLAAAIRGLIRPPATLDLFAPPIRVRRTIRPPRRQARRAHRKRCARRAA